MNNTAALPEWAVVGAEVVIIESVSWGSARLTTATITRTTATQALVEYKRDGQVTFTRRFKAQPYGRGLREMGVGKYGTPEMIAGDDERVARFGAVRAREDAQSAARKASNDFVTARSVEAAEAAIAALAAYVALEKRAD